MPKRTDDESRGSTPSALLVRRSDPFNINAVVSGSNAFEPNALAEEMTNIVGIERPDAAAVDLQHRTALRIQEQSLKTVARASLGVHAGHGSVNPSRRRKRLERIDMVEDADPGSAAFVIALLEQLIGALGRVEPGILAELADDMVGAAPDLPILDHGGELCESAGRTQAQI